MLLLDCINIIRKTKLDVGELYSYAYLTSYSHGFDWMLKETGLKIQFLDDELMYS